jgi:arylsulfatase A-like enzyme
VLDDGYQDQAVEALGEHKPSGPLRGGKGSGFEGGTRVPFILSWPAGGVPQGKTSHAAVSHLDFFASMAALAGQTLADDAAPDSFDQLAAWLGKDEAGREYVMKLGGPISVIEGDWKYIVPGNRDNFVTGNGNESGTSTGPQLYNLRDDLGERNNIAAQHPDKVEKLAALIETVRNNPKSRK